ncbi:MAG: WxcM-like domain-containing protein [Candidatus Doudnabacteria bacterium]|nr:WxcM-like domain-containing protein [Candidatus Doudnabacteria bacterium]
MPERLVVKEDTRGRLVEVFKFPDFVTGQILLVTAKPGMTRGNHYHARKSEQYCVVKGSAKIRLRNRSTNEMQEHDVSGEAPKIVEIEPNWTHNIQNTGKGEMTFLIWISEIFNPSDPDTFFEAV